MVSSSQMDYKDDDDDTLKVELGELLISASLSGADPEKVTVN
jgi:hypothetical protein